MAGTVVAKTGIKREKGYLYYVDANGNVRKAKMKRGGKKGRKVCKTPKKRSTKAKKSTSRKKSTRKTSRKK